jgi:hypothetical protein
MAIVRLSHATFLAMTKDDGYFDFDSVHKSRRHKRKLGLPRCNVKSGAGKDTSDSEYMKY